MRRFGTGGLCAFGLFALAVFIPVSAPRSLELAAPQQEARLGFISTATGASLVRLNPATLQRSGRRLRLNGYAGVWAFAPDGQTVAIAVHPTDQRVTNDTLRFFTAVGGLRRAARPVPLGGVAGAVIWPKPNRVVAYVNDCCSSAASVLAIDPVTGRVVARTRIGGFVMHVAHSADSLVLLVADTNRIGPSRIVIVDRDGVSRTAPLDDIVAGSTWPEDRTSDPIGTRRIPGLAVDENGHRAFVVTGSGLVAEVDLASLVVSVHHLFESRTFLDLIAGWLTPAAEAKGMNGPALTARWLGDGLLGVAGTDETAAMTDGKFTASARPLGLLIVDTHDWTSRMLDPGADSFFVADGLLLVTGSAWSSDKPQTGMGVAAYGSDRKPRFQLLTGRAAWVGFVYRARAYVSVAEESALRVVDLASGRIVGARRSDAPWPLLGDAAPVFG